MPLKVETCLAQACVVPSGTNATALSGPCHASPAPPQESAGIHRSAIQSARGTSSSGWPPRRFSALQ